MHVVAIVLDKNKKRPGKCLILALVDEAQLESVRALRSHSASYLSCFGSTPGSLHGSSSSSTLSKGLSDEAEG